MAVTACNEVGCNRPSPINATTDVLFGSAPTFGPSTIAIGANNSASQFHIEWSATPSSILQTGGYPIDYRVYFAELESSFDLATTVDNSSFTVLTQTTN